MEKLRLEAFLLYRSPSGESGDRYDLYAESRGHLVAWGRRPSGRRAVTSALMDLFDLGSFQLQQKSSQGVWFVQSMEVVRRHPGLGRQYGRLREASRLATLLRDNPWEDSLWQPLTNLFGQALLALETTNFPEAVTLKFLAKLLKMEGLPDFQLWLGSLSPAQREIIHQVLVTPVASMTRETVSDLPDLLQLFVQRLTRETDIRILP